MDEEKSEETLTEDEREEQPDTGETADEAHREGEFSELRELLAEVLAELASVREEVAKAIDVRNAAAIENGAVIDDAETIEPDVEIVDEPPIAEERDYTFDEE